MIPELDMTPFFPGLAAFFITLALTPLVRLAAIRQGWVARPREDRWHKKTTALMGGIAIFAGISLPLLCFMDSPLVWYALMPFAPNGFPPASATVMVLGATTLFVIGLVDDVYSLSPQSKLIGQILVAAMVTFLGFRLGWFVSRTLDTLVTLVWIVGITNAFNLLDNMDGLCAGVALVAAAAIAALYGPSVPDVFLPALVVAGACAGFLVYNFNPASIFMGDCGSLVIGFCLSVLPMANTQAEPAASFVGVAVPVLLLMVPIFDTTLVTCVRLLSGRKASTGGKDHTSHRLVLMGFSEKKAVLFLYGMGAVSGMTAIFVSRTDSFTSPAVAIPLVLSMVMMGVYLSRLRIYPEKEFSALRKTEFIQRMVDATGKRQLMVMLLDLGLVAFSWYLAYRIRFSGSAFNYFFNIFLASLPLVMSVKVLIFYGFGIYRGFWQYMSTRDILLYIKSSTVATICVIAGVAILYRFHDISIGVLAIDWLTTTVFLLAARGSFRFFKEAVDRSALSGGDPVLIYGAGRGGELLLRELLNNARLDLNPVGFIDDDPLKTGKNIQGVPVLGNLETLSDFGKKYAIAGVLVSFHEPCDDQVMAETRKCCREAGWFLKKFAICLETMIPESTDKSHDKQKIHN